jgi:hypothetical protein
MRRLLLVLVPALGVLTGRRSLGKPAPEPLPSRLGVRQWEFLPAKMNGRAFPAIVYGEVKFRLL